MRLSSGRKPLPSMAALAATALLSLAACTLEPPSKEVTFEATAVSGGGLELMIPAHEGLVSGIRHQQGGFDLLAPEGGDSLEFRRLGLELYDELTGRTWSDLRDSSTVREFTAPEGGGLSFERRFRRAPFVIREELRGDKEGVFLRVRVETTDQEQPLRSVRLSFLMPLPHGWRLWVPGMAAPVLLDDQAVVSRVYGPGARPSTGTTIPLVSVLKPGAGGVSLAVPLEIAPTRVRFDYQGSGTLTGTTPGRGEQDYLRITFDLAGVGPNHPLETGLWLYGHGEHWRSALGAFVQKYQPWFEPVRRNPELEGVFDRVQSTSLSPNLLYALRQRGLSLTGIYWNFALHGQWLPPQALRFEDFTWTNLLGAERYDSISVRGVREMIANLQQYRIGAMLYGAFNLYCQPELAREQFEEDLARDERGQPIEVRSGQLLMHADSTSPFGRQILEQNRQMVTLFPEASGFYFDDWDLAAIDFAHDDGYTVIHNRPAFYLGRVRAGLGEALAAPVRERGKLAAAAPPLTVAEARGIDMFFLPDTGAGPMILASLLAPLKPVVSVWQPGSDVPAEEVERILQERLLWGVMPSAAEVEAISILSAAYRPLFDQLKGRRWVLEPGALELETIGGVEVNLFSVPVPERSRERDLLVTVIRPRAGMGGISFRTGVRLRISLDGVDQYLKATWIPTVRTAYQAPVRLAAEEGVLVVDLPPVGNAGVLRLSRQ